MYDNATISGNKTLETGPGEQNKGGGVAVTDNGGTAKFYLVGGTIYGSEDPVSANDKKVS